MKQAVITGPRQAGVVEVAEPRPVRDWVKVKVYAAPMCTEVKGFVEGDAGHGYGHEAVGEVVETAQPCRVAVGDRVVVQPGFPCGCCEYCIAGEYIHCRHFIDFKAYTGGDTGNWTMAQYLLKADWLLSPIPDGVSYHMASLAICALGPTFAALDCSAASTFDTVLITGLGAVGLGGVVNAVYRGARVIGVESNPQRTALAKSLGAHAVLDPRKDDVLEALMDLTQGRGVDMAIDCSGIPAAHRLCMDTARRKGHVAFVGQCRTESSFVVSEHMIQKGLTFHGVWHYNLSAYPRVMQVIQRSPVAEQLITHVFPIDAVQTAWEIQAQGDCGKVILEPWS